MKRNREIDNKKLNKIAGGTKLEKFEYREITDPYEADHCNKYDGTVIELGNKANCYDCFHSIQHNGKLYCTEK